jgi:tetratricopeptide (TPR) repeat protein
MRDERLEAGRHHLQNGERALRRGVLVDGRQHFEAALLQFRGPELRIGEAHALRGLAAVELGLGNVAAAEAGLEEACRAYRDVIQQLNHFDREGVSGELMGDAREGEGAAMVLLGETMLRAGRVDEARHTLLLARDLFEGVGGGPAAAGVYTALGRLALREGRTAEARDALARSITLLGDAGDVAGESAARLLRAEADRLDGRLDVAADELSRAAKLARRARDPGLVGRSRSALGSVLAQRGRLAEAEESYTLALEALQQAGDTAAEAFALLGRGDVRSQRQDLDAIRDLQDGARWMVQLEHRHGLGLAMLRIGAHLVRLSLPAYGLACAESARQLWLDSDPIRGVGQALRVQVKALGMLRQWAAMMAVAEARAALAGDVQPNAIEVRDHYRQQARERGVPAQLAWLDELEAANETALEVRSESMVQALIAPLLARLDLDPQSLGVTGGALALLQAVAQATPSPAAARDEVEELPDDAIEPLPPEEDEAHAVSGDYAGLYRPAYAVLTESPADEAFVVSDDDDEP